MVPMQTLGDCSPSRWVEDETRDSKRWRVAINFLLLCSSIFNIVTVLVLTVMYFVNLVQQ